MNRGPLSSAFWATGSGRSTTRTRPGRTLHGYTLSKGERRRRDEARERLWEAVVLLTGVPQFREIKA